MAPSLEENQDPVLVHARDNATTMPKMVNSASAAANGFFSAVDPKAQANLAPLDASRLTTTYTTNPRDVPALDSAERYATSTCSDHMVMCEWNLSTGWGAPYVKPYGPLSLMPTTSVFHYATECFEGLKLYRGYDGKLRLFRPELNAKRMLNSSQRIALPGFDPAEWLKLIIKLCAVDGSKWLPKSQPGSFLYLRPTMIANDPGLGVRVPKSALFYAMLVCFPVMDDTPTGLRLLASSDNTIRAWPGGFGWAKVGANYGPSLIASGEANRRGYQQILWLLADGKGGSEVTESGAMNFFVVWRNREGTLEMVTPPLDSRVILDGVTRRSILELARERLSTASVNADGREVEEIMVLERRIDMEEIVQAADESRLVEAFTCGTAFFVSPVSAIHYKGRDLDVPMAEGSSGTYARLVKSWMKDIMYGNVEHDWACIVDEE